MTEKNKKATFITSTVHALIGRTAGESDSVAPGERVAFDENAESHQYLRSRIEEGDPDYAHLSIQEVDLKAEQDQEQERAEMLEKAEEIAAEARQEETQANVERLERADELRQQAEEEGQPPVGQGADFPPQDREAQRIAKESGAGQRASTQDDVADEDQPKQGRRSSRSKG